MDLEAQPERLSEELREERNGDGRRKERRSLALLAENTGMSERSLSLVLQLLRLPEDVKTMVGERKLRQSYSTVLLSLVKTPYRHCISSLAQQVVRQDLSTEDLRRKVESIKKKGCTEDKRVCVVRTSVSEREHDSP